MNYEILEVCDGDGKVLMHLPDIQRTIKLYSIFLVPMPDGEVKLSYQCNIPKEELEEIEEIVSACLIDYLSNGIKNNDGSVSLNGKD